MDPEQASPLSPESPDAQVHEAQQLLNDARDLGQKADKDLKNVTRKYEKVRQQYDLALADANETERSLEVRERHMNNCRAKLFKYTEHYNQAAKNYLTWLSASPDDHDYRERANSEITFEVTKKHFFETRHQWHEAAQDYQQESENKQQATSRLAPLKQNLDSLLDIKEKITVQCKFYSKSQIVMEKNLQQALAAYNRTGQQVLWPHPNQPPRSHSGFSSAHSVCSSTSTPSVSLSVSSSEYSDASIAYSHHTTSPPSSPIMRSLSSGSMPITLSPVKTTDLLHLSPSKYLNLDTH